MGSVEQYGRVWSRLCRRFGRTCLHFVLAVPMNQNASAPTALAGRAMARQYTHRIPARLCPADRTAGVGTKGDRS